MSESLGAMMTSEDVSEREQLQSQYSDYYKEAYGFRPRHSTTHWTVLDFNDEFARLGQTCQENAVAAAESEAAAVEKLEATIANLISIGAKNREVAIRWIADGEQVGDDMDHLCSNLGIPYGYLSNVP